MKLNKFFLLFIFILSITSCAFLLKPAENDKEKLLYAHLKFWENIRIDGIIEANYKSYVFRKNITIKKNSSAFRIDIYDSGIFGMQPTPFISAYYDSILTIRTQDQEIEHISIEDDNYFSLLFNLNDLFVLKDDILKHKRLFLENLIIIFSDNMKISEIRNNTNSTKINFNYLHDMDSITFLKEEEKIINIQIDKITYAYQEINKLK